MSPVTDQLVGNKASRRCRCRRLPHGQLLTHRVPADFQEACVVRTFLVLELAAVDVAIGVLLAADAPAGDVQLEHHSVALVADGVRCRAV